MTIKTLLVDDERSLLEQAKIFLERIEEGLEISTAISPDEALKMMDEENFDVIVSDYQMPDMDGIEFLAELREIKERDIPFIMFTGKGREEVAMEALNLGADRYIQKGGDPTSQYGVLAQAIKQEVEHHQTHKALKKSEKRYESITEDVLEYADFGIVILDSDLDVVWINRAIEEYFGIEKEEVIGKDKKTLVEEKISPIFEDPERFKQKVLATYRDNNYVEDFECHVLPDVDLSERWLRHWSKPIKRGLYEGGRIEHYTDITEKKKTKKREELFSSSLEKASLEVYWVTPEGGFVFANQTARDKLGYSEDELKGMHVWDIDPNYPKEKREEFWEELKNKGRQNFVSSHIDHDGEEYPVEITCQYIEDEGEGYEFAFARDITEKEEKENEIKELDRLHNAIIEDSNTWLILTDEEGNVLIWNNAAEEISGYDAEEVEGSDEIWELLYPEEEYRKNILEKSSEIVDGAEVNHFETEIERKDGEKRIISWNSRALKENDGEVIGILGLGRDVTDQKEVKRDLKNERKKYETLFEENPEAVVEVDEEFKVVSRVNRRFEELFGYDQDEIRGEYINDLVVPEDKKDEALELDKKAKEFGYFDHETVRVKNNGESINVAITGRPIEQDDGTHYLAVYRDIRDRKKAEELMSENKEKIENIHRISAELELFETEQEIYDHTVKAAERILDFDICAINVPEGDFFKAISTSSEFPENSSATDKPLPIDDSLAGKTFKEKRSFLIGDKEENEYVNPTRDDFISGISVPIGDFGVFQAVSDEIDDFNEEDVKMTELLMDHVSEALNRVNAKKRENFLHSLLRHDVGNKTRIIKGYLDLTREEDIPEEARNFIDKADRAAEDSLDIIEKVRKLRKIEEKEEIEKIDLKSVIDKVASELDNQLVDNGMGLNRDLCDCKVVGGALLEELFSNLIENSIRHSEGDEIRVQTHVEGDKCSIMIEDDGKGIPDELKGKVFDRGVKSGKNSGTGLGLYMVREIAESYGGDVSVDDSDMGGARFEVRLEKIDG